MKISSKIYKNLVKKMPELNKVILLEFEKWWKCREELKKILKQRELLPKELNQLKQICMKYKELIEDNIETLDKFKVKYKIQIKYLQADIEFCDRLNFMDKEQHTNKTKKGGIK